MRMIEREKRKNRGILCELHSFDKKATAAPRSTLISSKSKEIKKSDKPHAVILSPIEILKRRWISITSRFQSASLQSFKLVTTDLDPIDFDSSDLSPHDLVQ